MADTKQTGAIGDAANPRTMETDPNGARTAVGIPHPENEAQGDSLPAVDLSDFELDDYDDDKQRPPAVDSLPPDQDTGESFPDLIDLGETPEDHAQRGHHPRLVNLTDELSHSPEMEPTVDNQLNQPERFANRKSGG